jgi:hypothetical protein
MNTIRLPLPTCIVMFLLRLLFLDISMLISKHTMQACSS